MAESSVKFFYILFLYIIFASLPVSVAKPKYAPGRVLVQFSTAPSFGRSSTSLSGLSLLSAPIPLNNSHGDSSRSSLAASSSDSIHVFAITDGSSVSDKISELMATGDNIVFAEPDYHVNVFSQLSDPQFPDQWHHPIVSTPDAWNITEGSQNIKVCVIDSGVLTGHPDLASNVVNGWNVIPVVPGGPWPSTGSPDWLNFNDTLGHGTHVAGIIGAVGNNAVGVTGVAWNVGLLPCRFIDSNGVGYISGAITCIRLCKNAGASVFSSSWAGPSYSQSLYQEIQSLEQNANGVFVVAAGNNGNQDLDQKPMYPAAYNLDNIITVAAIEQNEGLASYSNVGTKSVDLAAPGSAILSTTSDGSYGEMSGTSMAAPIVSGAVALMQDVVLRSNQEPFPPSIIKSLLTAAVDPLPWAQGVIASGGKLNVSRALQAVQVKLQDTTWRVEQGLLISSPPPPPTVRPPPPRVQIKSPPKKRKPSTGRKIFATDTA